MLYLAANCEDGDIKLVPDSRGREGVVLVCINRRWGPICDRYYDEDPSIMTMCTQLGYTGGEQQFYLIVAKTVKPLLAKWLLPMVQLSKRSDIEVI